MRELEIGIGLLYIIVLSSIMLYGMVYKKAVREAIKKMGIPVHTGIDSMLTTGILLPFFATLISLSIFVIIM